MTDEERGRDRLMWFLGGSVAGWLAGGLAAALIAFR